MLKSYAVLFLLSAHYVTLNYDEHTHAYKHACMHTDAHTHTHTTHHTPHTHTHTHTTHTHHTPHTTHHTHTHTHTHTPHTHTTHHTHTPHTHTPHTHTHNLESHTIKAQWICLRVEYSTINFKSDHHRSTLQAAHLALQLRQKWHSLFLRRMRAPSKPWSQNDEVSSGILLAMLTWVHTHWG